MRTGGTMTPVSMAPGAGWPARATGASARFHPPGRRRVYDFDAERLDADSRGLDGVGPPKARASASAPGGQGEQRPDGQEGQLRQAGNGSQDQQAARQRLRAREELGGTSPRFDRQRREW
jgi:hypothetical protein